MRPWSFRRQSAPAAAWSWPPLLLLTVVGILLAYPARAGAAGGLAVSAAPASPRSVYLPLVQRAPAAVLNACPAESSAQYAAIPVDSPPTDPPAAQHPDLNLALRGYTRISAPLTLVDYTGGPDEDGPYMPGAFGDGRIPRFTAAYQVYDWDWTQNRRGALLGQWPVTMLGMATRPGEAIRIPSRNHEVYTGGYMALVLYAESQRITLKYTREDNVIRGYTVHLEGVCVDPNLLALYRSLDAAGRSSLPGLHNGEVLGRAAGSAIQAAIRDTGTFMDPRARSDWWQGR